MNGVSLNKIGKIWGNTWPLFNKNNVEIHRIEVNKGGFCSKHKHVSKYNYFFIEIGKLKISVWKNNYDLKDITILNKKDSTIILPGEYHQFEALEDTIGYEIYWVELDENDIMRENHGGSTKYET